MSTTASSGRINGVKFSRNDYTYRDFRMWPLAVLTEFSYNIMYGCFVIVTYRGDCINEVTVRRRSQDGTENGRK